MRTASNFDSSNYFPFNVDGTSDEASFVNTYGKDYYFHFSFAAPNKTDQRLISDYNGKVTWTVTAQ